ncbi:MAG: Lrp/AsnC ligand binding domain-containing protein [Candidatus Aenigmarchaeota archaeon]|jgi:Lrp/AsnC family transcriptional regulator for asnA, asnC and gidA|nr:Lrp/AsnC ligand binding domain-containing protein [Candidatus Aenigmarchaeota archaeon]
MVRISDIDLIRELEKDCRKPFTEIAKKFKVSEAAIRKKVKKLLKLGIIRFSLDIDYKKLGYNYVAIIGIDVLPEHFVKIIEMLKEDKEVKELYTSTGDHMILAKVVFRTNEELNEFVKRLEKNKMITKVCPAIILERLK